MVYRVDLLIDTDLGTDVDDVGMLCAAHALADLGEARILAVTHGTNLDSAVGAISAINHYYNRDDIAIGAYHGPIGSGGGQPGWTREGRGVYVDLLVEEFSPKISSYDQVPPAVDVYRRTLAMADDGSVTLVCVGHATNLNDFLQWDVNQEMMARKVRQLIIMGGKPLWGGAEWNFAGCGGCGNTGSCGCGNYDQLGAITHEALNRIPHDVPVVYLGYEAGVDVHTGIGLAERNSEVSPCDRAYEIYCTEMGAWCGGGGRSSWDAMALLFGVRGDRHGYYTLQRGTNWIDARTGKTEWRANAAADGDHLPGTQLILNKDKGSELAEELNGLYMRLPRKNWPSPAHSASSAARLCEMWCAGHTKPWSDKCARFARCAGCYQCDDVLPSPSPLQPPPQSPRPPPPLAAPSSSLLTVTPPSVTLSHRVTSSPPPLLLSGSRATPPHPLQGLLQEAQLPTSPSIEPSLWGVQPSGLLQVGMLTTLASSVLIWFVLSCVRRFRDREKWVGARGKHHRLQLEDAAEQTAVDKAEERLRECDRL